MIAKDWALYRPARWGAALLFIMPIAIFFVGMSVDRDYRAKLTRSMFCVELSAAVIFGVGFTLLIMPVFGAMAFARERRDRSGEFLASFPQPRSRSVVSKAMVGLTLCALPWVIGLNLALVLQKSASSDEDVQPFIVVSRGDITITFLLQMTIFLFGMGWFWSSLLRSEVLATVIPLVVAVFLFMVVPMPPPTGSTEVVEVQLSQVGPTIVRQGVTDHRASLAITQPGSWSYWWNFYAMKQILPASGIISFCAGSLIALRRRTP